MRNIVIGQSGGPTAAINASLAGAYHRAKELGFDTVYGMHHGVEGLLREDLIALEPFLDDAEDIEVLKRTPASALGTCRYKLCDYHMDDSDYKKIIAVMEKFEIDLFLYIGGNDSMDTVKMLSDYAAEHGLPQRFMGIPKTVDNDLPVTDHCPGYGSAAKYIATSLKEVMRDNNAGDVNKPTIIVAEIMGRNAGWLTAAAALCKGADCKGVDAIFLPEKVFDLDAFRALVKRLGEAKKPALIAVSEGVKLADGRYVCELSADVAVDAFGHKQMSGTAAYLCSLIRSEFGYKTRYIEFSTLQRAASHLASRTDVDEAFNCGVAAVNLAVEGHTGEMIVMKRDMSSPYACHMEGYDIHAIADLEKTLPLEWITDDYGLTVEFEEYARPLIAGEMFPIFVDGLPQHLVIAE
ncbi:6-phosphofructokinase 1 [Lachnospiraceae bacterium XBD2001]|nr:6-phosphofructokinase 1 [Lachnospiraceae bacterium XBD2001]